MEGRSSYARLEEGLATAALQRQQPTVGVRPTTAFAYQPHNEPGPDPHRLGSFKLLSIDGAAL